MTAYADNITRPVRTLTEREVALLLRVTGQHVDGFRDHVIISMALATGLREHELLALNVGDVVDAGGRARRHVRLRVYKRSAKNPSLQEVVLSATVRAKLEKLVRVRRQCGEALTPDSPLFVSRLHKRLAARTVREMFANWQTRAGFERHFNFHALRHTACTGVYRHSRDLRLTQRFARHTSLSSTMIYTHPSDEDLVRAVQELAC
jgi:site-specific recombinase XerC